MKKHDTGLSTTLTLLEQRYVNRLSKCCLSCFITPGVFRREICPFSRLISDSLEVFFPYTLLQRIR